MKRILLILLVSIGAIQAYAQPTGTAKPLGSNVKTDMNRILGSLWVDSFVKLAKYASNDPCLVLGVDAGGWVVLKNVCTGSLDTSLATKDWVNARLAEFYSKEEADARFLQNEVDGSITNEIQLLSISHDTIFLTNGGYVVLPVSAEEDPVFKDHASFSITLSMMNDWNAAYGWGNHASAGYEVQTNKSTSIILGTSDVLYPSQKAVKTYVDNAVSAIDLSAYLTISSAAATYSPLAHTHIIGNITGLQAALDGKAALSHTHSYNDLSDLPTLFSGSYNDLTDVPSTFPPSSHTHAYSALSDVNLTSIANGQLAKYDAGTGKWINFTPTYISANQIITISGDASGSGATSISLSVDKFNAQLPSYYLNRTNHTGTQSWGTITGTPTTVNGYSITDAHKQGGNAYSATYTLGSTDAQAVDILSNNTRRIRLFSGGNIAYYNTTTDAGFANDFGTNTVRTGQIRMNSLTGTDPSNYNVIEHFNDLSGYGIQINSGGAAGGYLGSFRVKTKGGSGLTTSTTTILARNDRIGIGDLDAQVSNTFNNNTSQFQVYKNYSAGNPWRTQSFTTNSSGQPMGITFENVADGGNKALAAIVYEGMAAAGYGGDVSVFTNPPGSVSSDLSTAKRVLQVDHNHNVGIGVAASVGPTANGSGTYADAKLHVLGTATGTPVEIIQGASSQTADLSQWKNNAGTILNKIDKDGHIYLNNNVYLNGVTYTASGLDTCLIINGYRVYKGLCPSGGGGGSPAVTYNRERSWQTDGTAVSLSGVKWVAGTGGGTSTFPTPATTNIVTRQVGYLVTISTSANQRGYVGLESASGTGILNLADGNFKVVINFAFPTYSSAQRIWVGLAPGNAVPGSGTDPSAQTNIIGIGKDGASSTMVWMNNDASGTATTAAIGAGLTPSATTLYTLTYEVSAGTSVGMNLEVNDGSTVTNYTKTVTTDMPATSLFLTPYVFINNVASGVATALKIQYIYISSKY